LQIAVDALREFFILGRVADEAGIMLDGLVQKRRQVVDQHVRQPDAAKKRKRQRPGLLQRAIVYGARPRWKIVQWYPDQINQFTQ
jgi:hypothetical protein